MRTSLLLVLALGATLTAWAQVKRVHLYESDMMVWRDMVAHVDQGIVRMGNNWRGEVVFTLREDGMWEEMRVFQGFSTSTLDLVLTLRDNKVYMGDSHFTDAILYTIDDNKIHRGDSTFPMDVLYTLREERSLLGAQPGVPVWGVYRENSMAWSDRVAILEGMPSEAEVIALLLATGWL